jgi:hypothetical protein
MDMDGVPYIAMIFSMSKVDSEDSITGIDTVDFVAITMGMVIGV